MKPFPLRPCALVLLAGSVLALALAHADESDLSAGGAFGYTEPFQDVKMAFSETGVLTELPVQEGDAVKTGQILARLDYQVMEKDLEIARKELDVQSDKVDKLEVLAKDGRVSPEELKQAEADKEIDALKVDRAEAEIESRTLRSSMNGVVIEVKKQISESVDPSVYVLRVVQLDKLLVNMYLDRATAARFQEGAAATLYLAETQEKIPATVDFVSPVTNAASNTVRVKFVIENPSGTYRSGVRCELTPKASPAPPPSKGPSSAPQSNGQPVYQ